MPNKISDAVLSWATDLDPATIDQAATTASMPFVEKPLALMPDAHLGIGSTVGSVIATKGAIIPSCVGVDIGCGMIAQRFNIRADAFDSDDLEQAHDLIAQAIPSGIPNSKNRHAGARTDVSVINAAARDGLVADRPEAADEIKSVTQFGTLGSGNHFVELCEDEDGYLWAVLHSGSRNPGNTVARFHIEKAKGIMKDFFIELPDPNLAYLVEGRPEFDHYINDMVWAQSFAFESRQEMMAHVVAAVGQVHGAADRASAADGASARDGNDGDLIVDEPINCHHNYTTQEHHHGKNLWVTRKGAIQARHGALGVIPGSMATGSFIVEGLGSKASYCSASHGAGRKMSRSKARRELTSESLDSVMQGIAWNRDAESLLDEHPDAYKDLGEVMENQADLVRIRHRLTTILNYKGN